MYEILLVFHLIIAFIMIALILLQQGKGAQAGAAFGSGASNTVFGSVGAGNFLSRSTSILATLFFIVNLGLAYMTNKYARGDTLEDLGTIISQEVGEVEAQKPGQLTESAPAAPIKGADVPDI